MWKRSLLSCLFFLLPGLLWGCQTDNMAVDLTQLPMMRSAEQEIGSLLQDVHAGMESKRIFKVMAHVAPHYKDQDGRDYEGLRRHLNELFGAYRTIRITRTNPRIWVEGQQAHVLETFGTVASPMEGASLPPVNVQGQVMVRLERVGNRWMIVQWGPLR